MNIREEVAQDETETVDSTAHLDGVQPLHLQPSCDFRTSSRFLTRA